MHRMLRYKMCCQATKPCMGSWTCNLLKLAQALSGTPPGRAAVYGAGPLAGRLGWLSRPGRAPTKWDVAHSLDARPHLSTLHHCGPIVQSRGGAAPRIQYQSSNSVNFTIQGWVSPLRGSTQHLLNAQVAVPFRLPQPPLNGRISVSGQTSAISPI